jgi:predicted lipid-binding transport protein (Tim44 family)
MGNCPTVRYGEKVSWNVRSGHGCMGCMTPSFWNAMGSAYKRLPAPIPFLPNVTTDMIGGLVVGGIAGVTAVHGVGMGVRFKRRRMIADRERTAAATALAEPVAEPVVFAPASVAVAEPPADSVQPAPPPVSPPEPKPAASAAALETPEVEAAAEAAHDVETPAQPEER